MSNKLKKSRLGRGLSSLLSETPGVEVFPEVSVTPVAERGQAVEEDVATPSPFSEVGVRMHGHKGIGAVSSLVWVEVGAVVANPYQPRENFDEAGLSRLAESIKQDGVMQPVVVRNRKGAPGKFEVVAGERRWRAAKLAGLPLIPAMVRELDDRQLAEMAVIENLQREDLDPLEQGRAFAKLTEQFGMTHEQVASRVGLDRSTVTNLIRLLGLAEEVQEFVRRDQLSMGHVRCLLGIEGDGAVQVEMARKAVRGGWSVRKLEEGVKGLGNPGLRGLRPGLGGVEGEEGGGGGGRSTRTHHLEDLARQASAQLGTRVEIRPGRGKNSGRVVIDYFGLDQFDELMKRLGVGIE